MMPCGEQQRPCKGRGALFSNLSQKESISENLLLRQEIQKAILKTR